MTLFLLITTVVVIYVTFLKLSPYFIFKNKMSYKISYERYKKYQKIKSLSIEKLVDFSYSKNSSFEFKNEIFNETFKHIQDMLQLNSTKDLKTIYLPINLKLEKYEDFLDFNSLLIINGIYLKELMKEFGLNEMDLWVYINNTEYCFTIELKKEDDLYDFYTEKKLLSGFLFTNLSKEKLSSDLVEYIVKNEKTFEKKKEVPKQSSNVIPLAIDYILGLKK